MLNKESSFGRIEINWEKFSQFGWQTIKQETNMFYWVIMVQKMEKISILIKQCALPSFDSQKALSSPKQKKIKIRWIHWLITV